MLRASQIKGALPVLIIQNIGNVKSPRKTAAAR